MKRGLLLGLALAHGVGVACDGAWDDDDTDDVSSLTVTATFPEAR